MLGSSIYSDSPKVEDGKKGVVVVYILFASLAGLVYHLLAEGELSSILTLSAVFQTLAFSLLTVQVFVNGSVSGISAKTLQLEALSIVCRLCSTTWLNGYVPSDYTGEFLYQAFDFVSLGAALWILHQLLYVRPTEADEDELPVFRLAMWTLVPACLLYADLNDRPVFDILWMWSFNLGSVAACPQLWMITQRKSTIQTLTAHFVGVMGFSRFLIGLYLWYGNEEITCEPWVGEFEHAGYAVIAASAIHVAIISDFIYYYVKNLATSGLDSPLELNEMWEV